MLEEEGEQALNQLGVLGTVGFVVFPTRFAYFPHQPGIFDFAAQLFMTCLQTFDVHFVFGNEHDLPFPDLLSLAVVLCIRLVALNKRSLVPFSICRLGRLSYQSQCGSSGMIRALTLNFRDGLLRRVDQVIQQSK